MQIFQRLFKVASVQGAHQNTTTTTAKDKEDEPKDIVRSKKRRSKSKKFKPIIFVCNKDIAKACFYSSIYLRKVKSSHKTDHHQPNSQSMMKINKKQDQKSDSSKVLPLSVSPSSSNISSKEKKQNKLKAGDNNNHKSKPMSRMKELLRWAAAASNKSEKGEKLSQRVKRGALKAVSDDDDDRLSSSVESPKISFSTSFSSSSNSGISMASSLRNDEACNVISLNSTPIHGLNRCSSRRGNWITTDSEFVVLEL